MSTKRISPLWARSALGYALNSSGTRSLISKPRTHHRRIRGASSIRQGSSPYREDSGYFEETSIMGWLYSSYSRSELIHDLIQPEEHPKASIRVIAHTLRGNVLWSVVEVTAKVEGVHKDLAPGESIRYIRCDLLQRSGGQWGYKGMDESVHPYYYTCPLSYLDMAPVQSSEWREGVRAYHARRCTSPAATAALTA